MTLPAPPRAEPRPSATNATADRIEDPYAWLRDPGYPEVKDEQVLDYLKAENAYFKAAWRPTPTSSKPCSRR